MALLRGWATQVRWREPGFTRFVDNLDIKNPYMRITHLIGCLRLCSQNALKERTYPCFVN